MLSLAKKISGKSENKHKNACTKPDSGKLRQGHLPTHGDNSTTPTLSLDQPPLL
jgi:hypothetical protein